MPNRSFKLIYLSHDLTKKIEWSLTKKKVKWAVAAVVCVFVLFNIGVGVTVSKIVSTKKTEVLAQENHLLRENVANFDLRLHEAAERMSYLAESDNMLRLMANLPLLEADVRNVGVGGSVTDPILMPTIPEVNKVSWTLDKLEREIELQRASFEEINEKFQADAALLEHMPTLRPVDTGYMSSFFGVRPDPFTKKLTRHCGLDYSAPRGTPVKASAGGKVVYAGVYYNYGKFIVIDHGQGYETAYGHLNKVNVKKGQTVFKGDIIGQVGSTGRSTAPHLHYEVRINGVAVNPINYVFDESERFPTLAASGNGSRHN